MPEEVALIQEATRRVLEGEPFGTIMKDWRQRGLTTANGSTWQTTQLRRVLLNPQMMSGGVVTSDEQRRLLAATADKAGRRKLGRPAEHLLSGLVFCHCNPDRPIYVTQYGAGRLFYSCRTDSRYGGCGLRVSERALDAWITDAIVEAVCGSAFAASIERRLKAAAADDPTPEELDADRLELGELELILPTRCRRLPPRPVRRASDSHRAGRVQAPGPAGPRVPCEPSEGGDGLPGRMGRLAAPRAASGGQERAQVDHREAGDQTRPGVRRGPARPGLDVLRHLRGARGPCPRRAVPTGDDAQPLARHGVNPALSPRTLPRVFT